MAKTAGYTLGLTLSGFPGLTQANFIIDSLEITGSQQELVEVNDLSDSTLWRDYILGLKEKGEISVTVYGAPQLELGATGVATISSATGAGHVELTSAAVVITATPDISTSKSEPLKTTLKYKILPSVSRLAPTGATGDA